MVEIFKRLILVSALCLAVITVAIAQQPSGPNVPPPANPSAQLPAETSPFPPQVVSVVHRLNGLKLLNLLRRKGAKLAPLSDEAWIADDVHTSIVAGLALGDGRIIARLPQAEVESSTRVTVNSASGPGTTAQATTDAGTDLSVLPSGGRPLAVRYIGLDGGTGLSLLQSSELAPAPPRDAAEETLVVGQRIRLVAPVRGPEVEGISQGLSLSLNEFDGKLSAVVRGTSGKATLLTVQAIQSVQSAPFSRDMIGAVAVNDTGETVGIVNAANGTEAQIIPIGAIRRAALRISLRLENKPQPWLGARGEAVAVSTVEQMMFAGWKREAAENLLSKRYGVLLTSVPPDTPAAYADLRAGDVVVRVNKGDVRSAEDFASRLAQAGSGVAVKFTVLRPDKTGPRVVTVTLSETLNPVRAMETIEARVARRMSSDPLVAGGLETVAISPKLASRFNADGGVLVLSVYSESPASRAGVQVGDIVEALDGKPLTADLQRTIGAQDVTLSIVRGGHKMEVKMASIRETQR